MSCTMVRGIARAVRPAAQRAWGQGAQKAMPAAALFELQQRRAMSVKGIPEPDQKWYMLGVEIAGQMGDLPKDIKDANEIKAFIAGIEAQFSGSVDRSVVNAANGQALAEILAGRRAARVGPAEKEAAEKEKEATARSNAKLMVGTEMKEGVKKLPSGLLIETLVEGTGAAPNASSTVTVHYTGMLADGSVFDSSVERGEPASFAVAQVVKGFAEGILNMKVGGKVMLTMAPELAYGPAAVGPIPANSALQFEVELIAIVP